MKARGAAIPALNSSASHAMMDEKRAMAATRYMVATSPTRNTTGSGILDDMAGAVD